MEDRSCPSKPYLFAFARSLLSCLTFACLLACLLASQFLQGLTCSLNSLLVRGGDFGSTPSGANVQLQTCSDFEPLDE